MAPVVSYKWRPIDDLPSNHQSLAYPELRALSQVWAEQKTALAEAESLRKFNEQLRREWAIETGIIERLYTLDRGITRLLIERGIDAAFIPHESTDRPPELVAAMIRDHEAAIDFMFSFIREERHLTTSFIKELNALLTRHQDSALAVDTLGVERHVTLLKGDYKKLPNNPTRPDGSIHEYCPPEQVSAEIERLVELHQEHLRKAVAPEVEAAWLHHRFSQIHPFQDGNGRVARCLATLIFLKTDWFPLVITRDHRERYIDALELADRDDLRDLIHLFAALQKEAFVRALGLSAQVLSPARPEQVIGTAKEQLIQRARVFRAELERAKATAAQLQEIAIARFQEVAARLETELGQFLARSHRFYVDNESATGERRYYFYNQIIEAAKKLGNYYVNTAEYRAWTRLVLRADIQSELLLSFHAVGREYRGLIAVSACFFRREMTEEGERQVTDLVPLSDEIFQVNYRDNPAEAQFRFRRWLEEIITKGLEMWRSSL